MNQEEQIFLDFTSDLDVAGFWQENERCWELTPEKPRCPINLSPDDHWLFGFLPGISTLRYYRDKSFRDQLHLQANQLTSICIGKSFFDEDTWESAPKRIENLFGCEFAYTEGGTPWLVPTTDDPAVFSKILDQIDVTDISAWAIPPDFHREWETRKAASKKLPDLGTGSRGPATVITSILHPETAFYWMIDHPDLMVRFRDLLVY